MRFVNLLFFYLFLSACSTVANIDYDKNFNFDKLKSFSVQEKPIRISADTRVNSPFMQKRVLQEIKSELIKKDFVNKEENAELKIKYYLDIKREFESYDSGVSLGFGSFGRHSAIGLGFNIPAEESRSIDKLRLTIDVFLNKANKLIWRGSTEEYLERGSNPERNTVLIRQLVTEILKEFPPK